MMTVAMIYARHVTMYKCTIEKPDGTTQTRDIGNWRDHAVEVFGGIVRRCGDRELCVTLTDSDGIIIKEHDTIEV